MRVSVHIDEKSRLSYQFCEFDKVYRVADFSKSLHAPYGPWMKCED